MRATGLLRMASNSVLDGVFGKAPPTHLFPDCYAQFPIRLPD
jgi:hypothetical protein